MTVALYTDVLSAVVDKYVQELAIFGTTQNKNPFTDQRKISYNWACRWHHQMGQSSWWSVGDDDWRGFTGVLLGTHTADAERSSPTYYTSIDAVDGPKMCFLGVS